MIYSFPIILMNFRLIILEMELNDSFVSVEYTVQQCVLKSPEMVVNLRTVYSNSRML